MAYTILGDLHIAEQNPVLFSGLRSTRTATKADRERTLEVVNASVPEEPGPVAPA